MRNLIPTVAALITIVGAARAQNNYPLTPDSLPHPGVPQGEVTHYTWKSKIFPGTVRDYWVYVPKQYDPAKATPVMVFQDGGGFQDRNGGFRVPVVFDNLIAKGEMPPTIAIMINPGVVPATGPDQQPRYNRSYEYDAPTGEYAGFLIEEILPEVGKKLNLTQDPNARAICGASSGGIAAFVAAWERPDYFRRVISFIGSFTNLRGGHLYGSLIRKMEPKPLRVFLQDGANDQDIYSGNWYLGNQDVAAALKYAGYDYQFVVGTGGHDGRQGSAILPDALRWLWRDYPAPIKVNVIPHDRGLDVLIAGEEWHSVEFEGSRVGEIGAMTSEATHIVSNKGSTLFFLEARTGRVRLLEDKNPRFAFTTPLQIPKASALAYTPDLSLIVCQPDQKRMVVADVFGRSKTTIPVAVDHVTIASNGRIYATEAKTGALMMIDRSGKSKKLDPSIPHPTALQLSADQALLFVASDGQFITSYHIEPDGTLSAQQPYFDLYVPYGQTGSGATAMVTDTQGRLYVATTAGIQLLDQAGRVNGIVASPAREPVTAIAWGGGNLDTLYAVAGGKLYARKLKAKGVVSSAPPVKLPAPIL